MTGRYFNNTENLAAGKRTWRDRSARCWVLVAGSVSWGLLIPNGLVLSSDKPPAGSVSATVQVTAAPPFSLRHESAVPDQPHLERSEEAPGSLRYRVGQSSSDRPVAAEQETDLSRRAAALGQQMREQFFTSPGSRKLAPSKKLHAIPVAARTAESAPVRAASVTPISKTASLPRAENGPGLKKQETGVLRSVSRSGTEAPAERGTKQNVAEVIQQKPHLISVESSKPTPELQQPAAPADLAENNGTPGSWVLEVHGSHRIRVPHNVVAVRASNQNICEVLQVSSREVVVIGKATGIATVHLSFDSGAPEQLYAFRVSRRADGNGPTEETLAQLEAVLAQKFPGRDIELQSSRESLVVNGTATDRQEAIQILAFVRDTYLVPVVDRLDVPRGKTGGNR